MSERRHSHLGFDAERVKTGKAGMVLQEGWEGSGQSKFWATVSVTNVVTQNHICPLTPFNVEVTFMFMDWSAKSNRQKQH